MGRWNSDRWQRVGENSAGDPMYGRVVNVQADSTYEDMTKDELQELLRQRDLPVSGNKDELVARLNESD